MSDLITSTKTYVTDQLTNVLSNDFVYHNLAHTQLVVNACQELIADITLEDHEKEALLLAAWMHDLGYTKQIDNHEEVSAQMAKEFLQQHKADDDLIETVCALILATEMVYEPQNDLENIIRDADSSHIGSKSYFEVSELLRKEWELTQNVEMTDIEWTKKNIEFLTSHQFYSRAALHKWDKRKAKNFGKLLQQENKLLRDTTKDRLKKESIAIKQTRMKLPERGIETMFRVALRNHITLSDIADTKANILLSVNAIIISVALSNLIPKLDNPSNAYLIYPSLVFLGFTVASIVLSVLATRPNVTKGKFTKDDVANKKVNLLFFGNFHQMKLDEFEWAMNEMMQDRDYLYSSLTKDLYFLGLVLNRKYSLLRTTYTVFMIGIVVSVFAFAIAFYIGGGNT